MALVRDLGTRILSRWRRSPGRSTRSFVAEFAAEPFTEPCIAIAPAARGVYMLYRNGVPIYAGMAPSGIRSELERHRRGEHGACTAGATAFDYDVTSDPERALREYLRTYMALHGGRLPPCNEAETRKAKADGGV